MNQTIPLSVAKRATTNYVVVGECWESTYSVGSHGYAQVGWFNKAEGRGTTTAHRAAWMYYTGNDPQESTVDHECRNRICVREEHLRPLINWDNARMNGAAGHYPVEWSCHRNHPWTRRSKITGNCLDCRKIARETYKERKKT